MLSPPRKAKKTPHDKMSRKPPKFFPLFICLLLAITTIAVFSQLRHHDFVNFDDDLYIYENRHVKSGITTESLTWAFTNSHAYNFHPLTTVSHMLDCRLFGPKPGPHHIINVIFHAANALLLLLVLSRMTKNFYASAFVAAAFALHPLHVESVAWISERKDVLSTFFWLLTMLAWLWYAHRPAVLKYITVLILFALGLMAKQMLVTLPFVLLLCDYWPLGRFKLKGSRAPGSLKTNKRATLRRCILEKIPLILFSAIASAIVFIVQQKTGLVKSVTQYPFAERLTNALVAYVAYIVKMCCPTNLAIFYPHPGPNLPAWKIAGSIILLLAITIAVLLSLKRRPYLAVGWLWYLGALVPVIGLVQVGLQAYADRYTYIPLIGIFIMIAWSLPEMLARLPYRKPILSISAVIVLATLAAMTRAQTAHWQNSTTLYEHATKVIPNNEWAYNWLGHTQAKLDDLENATTNFQKAIDIKPDFIEAHCNLGRALTKQGKFNQALVHLNEAFRLKPEFARAHSAMAELLIDQRRPRQAIVHYRQALETDPENANTQNGLGTAFAMMRKPDIAADHFKKALRINPDHHQAHLNLGAALAEQGDFQQGVYHLSHAIRLKPRSIKAHLNLGVAFYKQKKYDQAAEAFKKALKIDPKNPHAQNYLRMTIQQKNKSRTQNPNPK